MSSLRTPFFSSLLLCSFLLFSCAGAGHKSSPNEGPTLSGPVIEENQIEQQPVGSEAYGPALPPEGEAPPIEEGALPSEPVMPVEESEMVPPPEPVPPRLCVVLGPGMAKAMAEAAVLEAIRKAEIPVHCVVGTEMGAIVGALFAAGNGSTNNLQWQLFKFNKDNYLNFPLLSLRDPKSSGRGLNDFLRKIFRTKRIESLPMRFATAAVEVDSDSLTYFEEGDLAQALSASAAMPGIFDPWKIGDQGFVSAAVFAPAPLELARNLGGNFLVLVDVVSDNRGAPKHGSQLQKAFLPVRNLMRMQKKEASFVIRVEAGGIGYDEFNRQGEILAAGAKAAERAIPSLKEAWERWVVDPK